MTSDIEPLAGLVGHEPALEAIRFAAIRQPGYPGLRSLAWLVGLVVLAALMAAGPAQAQSCPGYRVVQSAAASFNQAASSGSLRAFAAVLERHADVSRVAMFALGPYRRALPAAQRGEYVQLTRQFLGRVLAEHAGSFAGAKVVLLNCTRDRGFTLVDTRVGAHPIVWRLDGNRIVDMKVGGIWLSLQMRSNFVSVIQRGNGNPAVLIDYLRSGRSLG
jgi:ABC-type transporter MlaC component